MEGDNPSNNNPPQNKPLSLKPQPTNQYNRHNRYVSRNNDLQDLQRVFDSIIRDVVEKVVSASVVGSMISSNSDNGLVNKNVNEEDSSYFNLYTTKEEVAYHQYIVDNPRSPIIRICPKIRRGNPWNIKIPCMIGYRNVEHAYIDTKSPINVMSSAVCNDIMNERLKIRRDPKYPGGVCNFVGRVKDVHGFIGNFTYLVDFVVLEDIGCVIDYSLSQVVLGKPFVEKSKMSYNKSEGTVRFMEGNDEITYRMPWKMNGYGPLSLYERDNIRAFEEKSEDDVEKGLSFMWEKMRLYYKDCLTPGPRYRVDENFVNMIEFSLRMKNETT